MWTTRRLITRSREIFNSPLVPAQVNRKNRHKWVRAVQRLGDRWVYWHTMPITEYKNENIVDTRWTPMGAERGAAGRDAIRARNLGVV